MDGRTTRDGRTVERMSAGWLVAAIAASVTCIAATAAVWIWAGAATERLTLEESLRVIAEEQDPDRVRAAATQALVHIQRGIDALSTLARRDDRLGGDARILLIRLRESLPR